jgi:hypothetical protein
MLAPCGFVQFRPLFREAAGYLNTAARRPTDFPFRVFYSCALPGHKTMDVKKPRLSGAGGMAACGWCVQHLCRILVQSQHLSKTMDHTSFKQCCRCRSTLPASTEFFSACQGKKDGLTSQCKKCRALMWKSQYEANREYYVAKATARTAVQRQRPEVAEKERIRSRLAKRRILADPLVREAHRLQVREWFRANAEYVRSLPSRTKALRAHYSRMRDAAKLRATPCWVDVKEIAKLYVEAQRLTESTGIVHEVDHIVPLRHQLVSGLHVHQNLRVVTRAVNRIKSNHFNIS